MISRRKFLMYGAASLAALSVPARVFSKSVEETVLNARAESIQLLPPGYPQTDIWGYDGLMPGPLVRLKQGARLAKTLLNSLPQPTSTHWHGLRIDNVMDGVAGLSQRPVETGGRFDYDFVVPDAGTFWYHAHNRSVEQVARGLYGALIVEEPDAPDVDREETLILDDFLVNPNTAQINPNFDSRGVRSHAGRIGNFTVTNGRHDLTLNCKMNERLRLRLINAANARIFVLALSEMKGWTVALDGMPLDDPEPLTGTLQIGPGQRADLIVDITAEKGKQAHLVRVDNNRGYSQVPFPVTGVASNTRRGAPSALPPNPNMKVTGLTNALSAHLRMEGGAMGSLVAATFEGEKKSFRRLVRANQFWAFNGMVGMTDAPFLDVSKGRTVRMTIHNDTFFPHAMHLHGMHFREILKNGELGPLRDTLLLLRDETREIAFMADNPGRWLFHCHMLSHAESGMTTWLNVSA